MGGSVGVICPKTVYILPWSTSCYFNTKISTIDTVQN